MEIESSPLIKKSDRSIEEIKKESFHLVVRNSSASDITFLGVVKKSPSWIKSKFLNRGSFGSVYLATHHKDTSIIMAIKSAEISEASSLMNERRIYNRLTSPFIFKCYGDDISHESTAFGGTRTNYNLILEYCSGQSLADYIKANGGLPENCIKIFARDILYGLFYIHRKKIIHCDIKPDNIFLTPAYSHLKSNNFLAKIGDFGLAMEKGSLEYGSGSGHRRGTTKYMAPELISHGIVDYGVDTWAFGCTVLEMFTGKSPWGEYENLYPPNLVFLIGQSGFIPYIPDWMSKEAKDFMSKCLVKEPGLRWGIHLLMNHPFLD